MTKKAKASDKVNLVLGQKRTATDSGLDQNGLDAKGRQAVRNAERFQREREGLVQDAPFPEIIKSRVCRHSLFDDLLI